MGPVARVEVVVAGVDVVVVVTAVVVVGSMVVLVDEGAAAGSLSVVALWPQAPRISAHRTAIARPADLITGRV
jgi:hypothetical protein